MKIQRFDISRMRTNEHFQFMTRVRYLVKDMNPVTLRVGPQYDAFVAVYNDEDTVLKKIFKSAVTTQIVDADRARDITFRGMADTVLGAVNHYDAATRAAAERVQNIMNEYGNVAKMTLDEETSAVYNLLQELVTKHAADVERIDIMGWITELDKRNNAFEKLMHERFEETTERTDLVMREVRLSVDAAYHTLADRIDALQLISGDEPDAPWAAFIAELNAVIERESGLLAQRKGRADTKK